MLINHYSYYNYAFTWHNTINSNTIELVVTIYNHTGLSKPFKSTFKHPRLRNSVTNSISSYFK